MKFVSTRNVKEIKDSKDAVINGLASDGGLYVPVLIKKIDDIYSLKDLNYRGLALEIIYNVFDDVDKEDLKKIIDDSYNTNFKSEDITPLHKVNNKYFLDLTKGPTSAFKDVALQFLPRLLSYLNNDIKKIVILTATSGDTGKAALEGFKDLKDAAIKVLYPYKMVSVVQERQMITTTGNNTDVIAVNGNFDDCQRMVKDILENESFDNIHLTSANSINIARLIPQCVYYFKAYFDLLNNREIKIDELIDFVVPTGNFGDILAGYLAKCMGLPVNKLIVASNCNSVLTDFISTGIYDAKRKLYNTMSPSIDILISSNLERLLYLLSNDDELVNKLMDSLKKNGMFKIDKGLLDKIQEHFDAYACSEQECKQVIKEYYLKYDYLADPHTAVGIRASEKYEPIHKQVILSTASPYKFSKDVYYSIFDEKIDDNLEAIDILKSCCNKEVPHNLEILKDLPIKHNTVIDKEDKAYIIESLKKIQ